jgi:hypothetical protein
VKQGYTAQIIRAYRPAAITRNQNSIVSVTGTGVSIGTVVSGRGCRF